MGTLSKPPISGRVLEVQDLVEGVEKVDVVPRYTFAGASAIEAIGKASHESVLNDRPDIRSSDNRVAITVTDAK